MKGVLMGIIMAGAILSSGCATVTSAALANRGVASGGGQAMIYKSGPAHETRGEDYHSLADPVAQRPSPGSAMGTATPRVWLTPEETPVAEWGILGFGVRGLSGADIKRLGLGGYAKSWAESGLGRSLADISHDPTPIWSYVQLRVFPGWGGRRLLLY